MDRLNEPGDWEFEDDEGDWDCPLAETDNVVFVHPDFRLAGFGEEPPEPLPKRHETPDRSTRPLRNRDVTPCQQKR